MFWCTCVDGEGRRIKVALRAHIIVYGDPAATTVPPTVLQYLLDQLLEGPIVIAVGHSYGIYRVIESSKLKKNYKRLLS